MAFRKKQQRHASGLKVSDMDELAVLLLKAFQGSIQQQLDETGEVNPRLLAEAVKWLKDSGVQLKPDSSSIGDLSNLVAGLHFLYDSDEAEETQVK